MGFRRQETPQRRLAPSRHLRPPPRQRTLGSELQKRSWALERASAPCSVGGGRFGPEVVGAAELLAILTNIAHLLGSARWASILPSIDAAERDPDFAEIHSSIQRGHAAPIKQALDRAAARGEIPAKADRSAMAAALMGPLFYRRWFSREPINHWFIESLIQSVVRSRHWETPKKATKNERNST